MSFAKFDNISNDDPIVEGVIVESYRTNTYVNDVNVSEYLYRYKSNDGTEHTGTSFSEKYAFQPGDTVQVQVNSTIPSISRIKGTRTSVMGGGWIFFSFPFLLIGIGFLFFFRQKSASRYIFAPLRESSHGENIDKRTHGNVNKQPAGLQILFPIRCR